MQKKKRKQNIQYEQVYRSRAHPTDTVLILEQEQGITEHIRHVQGSTVHSKDK